MDSRSSLHELASESETASIYARYAGDSCQCSDCQNVRAQPGLVPELAKRLLVEVGIDLAKPGEIITYVGYDHDDAIVELEWPFIAKSPLPLLSTSEGTLVAIGRIEVDGCDLRWYRGGSPSPMFDESGRRGSVAMLVRGVRWVLGSSPAG